MQITQQRSYRCSYIPKAPSGAVLWNPEGVYPAIQVQAKSATAALEAAHALTGCPVIEAQRLEGGAV